MNGDDEIRSFFAHYAERYMAFDVDAVAALYEAPFLAVREGRPIHLPDAEAVRQHLVGLMAAYRDAGAAEAAIADLHSVSLGRSSALVTVRWHARAADGSLLRDFFTSYQLLRSGDGSWLILGYVYHD